MKKLLVFGISVLLMGILIMSGCSSKEDPVKKKELERILEQGLMDDYEDKVPFEDEDLNPKYDPRIYRDDDTGEMEILLTIGGVDYAFPYDEQYKDALLYLGERLPEKSTIMTWWPHAGMVMAYTESYVVAFAPSPKSFEIGEIARGDWPHSYLSTDEDLANIAQSFLSTDSLDTYNLMDDYTAAYILIFNDDEQYLNDFYGHLDRNVDEHFNEDRISNEGRLTVFNRMLKYASVANFGRIKTDDTISLYKKVNRFGS